MTPVRHARRADPLHVLRGCLVALTALGIAGTAFELASLKHWNGAIQLVPWVALVVLAGSLALHVTRPDQVPVVRGLALLVLAASAYGVWEHALVNYESGPLDQHFTDTWTDLSLWSQWWYAITRTVGPAPTLAPGMLGQAAATLMLATIGAGAGSTSTNAALASRHRQHPYPGRLPGLTCARPDTLVASAATGSPRRLGELAPNRHRRRLHS